MGERAAYLHPNELNSLASSQIGLVFCILEREAVVRTSRNDLHLYMVCWWENRGLVHRPSSFPLRYGWKEHGGFWEVDVGTSTLRGRVRRPRRKLERIH